MPNSFRDLVVWQRSMQLAIASYQLSKTFPKEEIYVLGYQLRKSAISIPSNIAEGHGRLNTGEFRQFLGIARASNFELQTLLELAKSVEVGDVQLIEKALKLSHEVGKMIYAILVSLNQT